MNALQLIQATVEPGVTSLEAGLKRLGFHKPVHMGTAWVHRFYMHDALVLQVKEFREATTQVFVTVFGGTGLHASLPKQAAEIVACCKDWIYDLQRWARFAGQFSVFVDDVNIGLSGTHGRISEYDDAATFYRAARGAAHAEAATVTAELARPDLVSEFSRIPGAKSTRNGVDSGPIQVRNLAGRSYWRSAGTPWLVVHPRDQIQVHYALETISTSRDPAAAGHAARSLSRIYNRKFSIRSTSAGWSLTDQPS